MVGIGFWRLGFAVSDWLEHFNGTCRRDEKYGQIIHYVGFHIAITVIINLHFHLRCSTEDTNPAMTNNTP